MDYRRLLGRSWFYFRIGYATYLTFATGYLSLLITVYYLAVKGAPELLAIFPKFWPFAVLCTLIGLPLSVSFGWFHYKRSPAYSSETDIQIEANPWYYKWPPGYQLEVLGPLNLEFLRLLRKIALGETLDESDMKRIEKLEQLLRTLNEGGNVGTPRRR